MTILLTAKAQTDLIAKGYGEIIIAESFTTFADLYVHCDEIKFNEIAGIISLPLTYKQALSLGYFADLDAFSAYLRISPVYRLATLAAAKNSTLRKLFHELNFWLTSEIGEKSPGLLLACWLELLANTKGSLISQLTQAEVDGWNKALTDCRMLDGYKLIKV